MSWTAQRHTPPSPTQILQVPCWLRHQTHHGHSQVVDTINSTKKTICKSSFRGRQKTLSHNPSRDMRLLDIPHRFLTHAKIQGSPSDSSPRSMTQMVCLFFEGLPKKAPLVWEAPVQNMKVNSSTLKHFTQTSLWQPREADHSTRLRSFPRRWWRRRTLQKPLAVAHLLVRSRSYDPLAWAPNSESVLR